MSSTSDSTRLHPLAAWRAMRNLMRDREDTRQVFLLMDALRGKTSLRQFARFRATATGRAVLAERRRLLDRLNDRAALAALPEGTLGRAYHDFMAAEDLSAQGLVAASNFEETLHADAEMTLFRERGREMHDLLHIVTGYGRDPLGEACLTAFTFAQTTLKGFALIALVTAHRIARALPGQPVRRTVLEGFRRGRRAGWLVAADWENLLGQPLTAVREGFAVAPARRYHDVLAALRARPTAVLQPAERAAA